MNGVATVAQIVVRVTFLVQIVLGIAFWTGHFLTLIPVHILTGVLLVLGLWTLAAVGARAGAPIRLLVVAALWGALLPVFGLTQDTMLTGDLHWIIQVLHLLVGVAAVGLAEALAARIKSAPAVAPS